MAVIRLFYGCDMDVICLCQVACREGVIWMPRRVWSHRYHTYCSKRDSRTGRLKELSSNGKPLDKEYWKFVKAEFASLPAQERAEWRHRVDELRKLAKVDRALQVSAKQLNIVADDLSCPLLSIGGAAKAVSDVGGAATSVADASSLPMVPFETTPCQHGHAGSAAEACLSIVPRNDEVGGVSFGGGQIPAPLPLSLSVYKETFIEHLREAKAEAGCGGPKQKKLWRHAKRFQKMVGGLAKARGVIAGKIAVRRPCDGICANRSHETVCDSLGSIGMAQKKERAKI